MTKARPADHVLHMTTRSPIKNFSVQNNDGIHKRSNVVLKFIAIHLKPTFQEVISSI